MKKQLDYYARMYLLNQKENKQIKYNITQYTKSNKDKNKTTINKSNNKNSRQQKQNSLNSFNHKDSMNLMRKNVSFNSMSFTKDKHNSTASQTKSNLQDNYNKILISAYEQSIVFLFSNLKEMLNEKIYNSIKNTFFNELEKNLLQIPVESSNKNISNLSITNSILLKLEDTKNKCLLKQKNFTQYSHNKERKPGKSHKSLYSLSKPGKTVDSYSPSKIINYNPNFLSKYFSFYNKSKPQRNPTFKQYYFFRNNNTSLTNLPQKNDKKNFIYYKGSCKEQFISKMNKTNQENIENSENINLKNDYSTYNNNNTELLSKIKSSLDDNLKGFFEFSYKTFLNKESERGYTNRSIKKNNN